MLLVNYLQRKNGKAFVNNLSRTFVTNALFTSDPAPVEVKIKTHSFEFSSDNEVHSVCSIICTILKSVNQPEFDY